MKISELMSQNIALSGEECEAVDQYIPIKTFKKGTLLLKADQIANDSYFTIKGCVRLYYVVDGED
ncbi:MAG: Crp/Fnr family transcriptional regulator, partial [Fulvivirga sp.]